MTIDRIVDKLNCWIQQLKRKHKKLNSRYGLDDDYIDSEQMSLECEMEYLESILIVFRNP